MYPFLFLEKDDNTIAFSLNILDFGGFFFFGGGAVCTVVRFGGPLTFRDEKPWGIACCKRGQMISRIFQLSATARKIPQNI